MFTYAYQQPAEYHFSLDSIHFAEFVASELRGRTDLSSLKVLDLCAGCGVIGFELSWYVRELKQITFIEVQEIYTEYFQQNLAIVNRKELQTDWHTLNYDTLLNPEWEGKFNLIVSNPPYFQSEHGMLSPSEFKNRCRFFLDSTFENYIRALANSLARGGQAYFLLRPLKHHGLDLISDIKNMLDHSMITVRKITEIRGNDVMLIEKLIEHQP